MVDYQWILCDSPSHSDPFAPLNKIGELTGAKARQFSLLKNRAGSASFQIRTDDDMAFKIFDLVDMNDIRGTVRKSIRIRRNKEDLWSGPIWGIDGQLDAGTVTINCVGWLETLQKKILRSTLDYSNSGMGTTSDTIAYGLLNTINAQDLASPLLVRSGSVIGAMPLRNRYYILGQTLGPALQELSDIESGYDYEVDPVTRELNLASWDSFMSRPEVVLGYLWGPNNLQKFGWQESAANMCNDMIVISQGAPVGPITDGDSIDQYGHFSEYNTITGANQGILPEYAEAELAVRSRPTITYNVTPFPAGTSKSGPVLFEDFNIGDRIYFTAQKHAIKIKHQAIRVFGASVALDDNGNETIQSLQLSPSGS